MTATEARHTARAAPQRRLRRVAALVLAVAVSACAPIRPPTLPLTLAQAEDRTPPVAVPAARAWINPPGILLVTQRALVRGSEQRIALTNPSTLGGDNQVILRSRITYGLPTRLRFEEVMTRVGGPPHPFEDLEPGEMLTAEDAMGTYFWTERRLGADTVCVLALRRVPAGARQLPENADFLDILLRNCIRGGSTEAALIPILAPSVATAPGASPGAGQTRLISPLAGPGTP